MIERNEASPEGFIRRLLPQYSVATVLFCVVLAATSALAQQSAGTVTETVTTRRDLNGRDAVSEKVVTHRARTNDEERVVIETYLPLEYADRLAQSRRAWVRAFPCKSPSVTGLGWSIPLRRHSPVRASVRGRRKAAT